jgi:hypothetical protein
MPRPQFSLKTLLWLPVCVACIFLGISIGERNERKRLQSLYDEEERKIKEMDSLMADENKFLLETERVIEELHRNSMPASQAPRPTR